MTKRGVLTVDMECSECGGDGETEDFGVPCLCPCVRVVPVDDLAATVIGRAIHDAEVERLENIDGVEVQAVHFDEVTDNVRKDDDGN